MILFNVITIPMLLGVLLNIVFKVDIRSSNTLTCGLFGYIGSAQSNKFSWDKFNILGWDNDVRGGDSVGRIVGNNVLKYVSTSYKTSFKDFVIKHKESEISNIALGHTRKASVGGKTVIEAQPIVLDLPTGEGKFALIHNGTLYNHEELADKYDVDHTGRTDSQVLAEILMLHGWGVLGEYRGAAALLIKDDRHPNTVFAWKGASKAYVKYEEERPLFMYREAADSVYFSSRVDGLCLIGGTLNGEDDTITTFDDNTIYEIVEGVIVDTVVIDRSNQHQTKSYVSKNTNGHAYRSNARSYTNVYGYVDDDDYEYERYQAAAAATTHYSIHSEPIVVPRMGTTNLAMTTKIHYARTRYYLNGVLMHGPRNINVSGIVTMGKRSLGYKTYYFYEGVMLKDRASYDAAKKALGKRKAFRESTVNTKILARFSRYPIATLKANGGSQDISASSNNELGKLYNGSFTPLFTNKNYIVSWGDLSSVSQVATVNAPTDHVEMQIVRTPLSMPEVTDSKANTEIAEAIASVISVIDTAKDTIKVYQKDCVSAQHAVTNLDELEELLLSPKFKSQKLYE